MFFNNRHLAKNLASCASNSQITTFTCSPSSWTMLLGWKTCQCTTAILSTAFWSLRAWKRVGRCFRPILSWLATQQN